jgi:3-phenylpropionate/cinnamic acid dioxygenase small subunit
MATAPDVTHPNDTTSTYVDDVFYDTLRDDLTEWDAPGEPLGERHNPAWKRLILEEAWLLDRRRFRDWLRLFSTECLYWVPANDDQPNPVTGDPQRQVTLAFDDRRRLHDRIGWLETGLAYSQVPTSSTSHLLAGHVRVPTGRTGEIKIRSSFVVHEVRADRPVQALAGWCGHVLTEQDGELKIARKIVCPVGASRGHLNLTFLL